jgi:hypothetical protein
MTISEEFDLALTVSRLRRRQRVLEGLLGSLVVFSLVAAGLGVYMLRKVSHPSDLKLRRLDIVDDQGISRVILAAPAPPPTYLGKQTRRDGPVSGVLLVDSTGTERGGYVTSDGAKGNALLTLDAQGKQTVLLLAEPEGSTLFRIWDRQNGSLVMGSGEAGPFLNVRKGDSLLFSAPQGNVQSTSTKPLLR